MKDAITHQVGTVIAEEILLLILKIASDHRNRSVNHQLTNESAFR
jgi:hypothetical protein